MNKFCLVAIMLFAIQRDMIDYPITDVINAIDRERGTMSHINFLNVVFEDAVYKYNVYDVSFGKYNKYLYI